MLARFVMDRSKSEELYAAACHAVIVIPLIGGIAVADVVSKNFPELETGKQALKPINKSNRRAPKINPLINSYSLSNLELETQLERTVYGIV